MQNIFDRTQHVYRSEALIEIIHDTIRFFNGTPVHSIPPPENFLGAGVYALYYIGKNPLYERLYKANHLNFDRPIYVGKAVPRGWRQARIQQASNELYTRLNEHHTSIAQAHNLREDDFRCRFMILEDSATDLIGTVEAALIRQYRPVWNSCIDGFGNHDPGSGRYAQRRSGWDTLHEGRLWAANLRPNEQDAAAIAQTLKAYLDEEV